MPRPATLGVAGRSLSIILELLDLSRQVPAENSVGGQLADLRAQAVVLMLVGLPFRLGVGPIVVVAVFREVGIA